MPVLHAIKNLMSIRGTKRFGLPNLCGTARLGWSLCGDENYASGIYYDYVYEKKRYRLRREFYDYGITNTAGQVIARTKFKNAMLAWVALSPAERAVYNQKAKGKPLHGCNVFVSEFMES